MKRGRPTDGPTPLGDCLRLSLLNIHCFGAARVRLNIEAHLLTLGQLRHTCLLDRRNVNEDILGAIFGGNEAEASRYVKKLHGTCRH